MKKYFFFLFLIFGTQCFSQITEGIKNMSMGDKNALTVFLTGVDVNDTEKIWKKYADQYNGKDKYNKKANELFIDNASISNISANTIDLYSRASKMGEGVEFSVWFDLGGAYLSKSAHPEKYENGEAVLNGLIREVEKHKINQTLEAEEKKLKGLNDDLKNLVKDKEGYEKDIKKAEEKIKESNEKITKNVGDQATKQTEIEAQQKVVDLVKENLSKI